MKTALVGINSKYVHTNLAVRKIRAYLALRGITATVYEYSGGEELHRVAADILAENYDCIGFSCYIWNIDYVLKLAEIIKTASPKTRLVFGGPEAWFSPRRLLDSGFADGIICGEGETVYEDMASGFFDKIMTGRQLPMEEMPFPYTEDELKERGRIFYYESSRGCPFGCSYCLSSADKGIRYRSAAATLADIRIFAQHNVRLVKFIDRTFNSNLPRSKEILRGLLEIPCDTEFHFEIAADTVDDEFIEILAKFPPGKIRLEAGLQSTNPKTLKAVNRSCNLDKLGKNIKSIIQNTNAILHLDLIAGLPYEDSESFKQSFNFAFGLNPHELQLGFLKVLPGTEISRRATEFGIKNTSYPPYEIISNNYISFSGLSALKDIEAVLDMYHNSGILKNTEPYILKKYETPFDFYSMLAQYFRKKGYLGAPHHRIKLFDFIHDFINDAVANEYLARDFLLSCKGAPAASWMNIGGEPLKKDTITKILSDDGILKPLPELRAVDKKQRHKHVRTERLFNMVWLTSYIDKKIVDITPYF